MNFITISALLILLFVCGGLCWLNFETLKSLNSAITQHAREMADKDVAYRALVESHYRQAEKIFVTPQSRFENARVGRPDPVKHAFKYKPPPPVINEKVAPRVGQAPDVKFGGKVSG